MKLMKFQYQERVVRSVTPTDRKFNVKYGLRMTEKYLSLPPKYQKIIDEAKDKSEAWSLLYFAGIAK